MTGDGAIDGAYGGSNNPGQPDPATCERGLRWTLKVTGTYDQPSHTITGTFP